MHPTNRIKNGATWRHPGLRGAALYALLAALLGAAISLLTNLRWPTPEGRRAAGSLPAGRVIVVANHTSLIDGIVLALACRRMGRSPRLLATAGVFRIPVVGTLAAMLGFIPVHRRTAAAAESLTAAAAALNAGEAVAMFPEGRITLDTEFWPEQAKTGAVRLALLTGAPIVPIAIQGCHQVVDRKVNVGRLLASLVRRPGVLVSVGAPIDVRRLAPGRADEATVRWISDLMMARLVTQVSDLRGVPAPHPHGLPRAA